MNTFEPIREEIIRHNILALSLPIPGCDNTTNTRDYKLPVTNEDISSIQSRARHVKQMFDKAGFLFKEEPKTSDTALESLIYGLLKDWFKASQFELTKEILAFSSKHGILACIPEVLTLLGKSFPLIESIGVKIVEDLEVGEEWLSFEVSVHGEVDEVLKSYDSYVTQFVSKIPWPECDKIRLSYFII